jgi:hypothetical protein
MATYQVPLDADSDRLPPGRGRDFDGGVREVGCRRRRLSCKPPGFRPGRDLEGEEDMNTTSRPRWGLLATAITLCALLLAPGMAMAVGTGDDPAPIPDTLNPTDAAAKRAEDTRFANWQASQPSGGSASPPSGGSAPPPLLPGMVRYLWTPSHAQERSYWCGPASVQIVSHYFDRLYSQATIATWMDTTTNGTAFSLVDDALRRFSTVNYYYYGPIYTWDRYVASLAYGIVGLARPVVVDVAIDGDRWPFYVNDHAGHILPVEAFDMSVSPYRVRVNDPYNEASWQSGGGRTGGHVTYPAYIIWWGLQAHWRHALVR